MKIKVVACRVFAFELEHLTQKTAEEIEIDYVPLRAHDEPDRLREEIQGRIDSISSKDGYEAVILAYGLCGNAISGLQARELPLYIPQAHDCSQILLGGRKAHKEYFGDNPSRGWTSRGYLAEEGDPFRVGDGTGLWDYHMLVEQYGEENAQYVWDTLHASDSPDDPILYYLDVPETTLPEVLESAREKAESHEKELQIAPGTIALLAELLGRGSEEILCVPPGREIRPSWDDEVLTYKEPEGETTGNEQ